MLAYTDEEVLKAEGEKAEAMSIVHMKVPHLNYFCCLSSVSMNIPVIVLSSIIIIIGFHRESYRDVLWARHLPRCHESARRRMHEDAGLVHSLDEAQ